MGGISCFSAEIYQKTESGSLMNSLRSKKMGKRMPKFRRVSFGLKNSPPPPPKKKEKYSRRAGAALENFSRNIKHEKGRKNKATMEQTNKIPFALTFCVHTFVKTKRNGNKHGNENQKIKP
jgi:hypothetical protein